MAKNIGFGLVGTGLIAPMHAQAIRNSKGGRLIAVCDIDKQRADKFGTDFGAKAYYTVESMLADKTGR